MLYIVGTPIGNLEDLSYRQAKVLASAKVILSEDTRSAGMLLQKIPELFTFKISEHRLISYYKENEFQKLPEILEMLEDAQDIVLISQAGMPLISDPGYLLLKNVIKQEIPFTVIPGPVASITALISSGFNPAEHMFLGFFPKKPQEIHKVLEKVKLIKAIFPCVVIIFYESPLRVSETLELISTHLPESDISISREMTKKFEETVRGKAKDLAQKNYRGEITVVIS